LCSIDRASQNGIHSNEPRDARSIIKLSVTFRQQ
jgi:hypothetical protein